MLLIDIDDVRNDIPSVIALKGEDYVYSRHTGQCAYIDPNDKTPSCLVGYYLINKLKVPMEFFEKGDGRNYREFPNITGELYRERGISFTREAEDFLNTLQELQDDGMAWGAALEYALNPAIDDEDEDDE